MQTTGPESTEISCVDGQETSALTVLDERGEEGLVLEVGVVLLKLLLGGLVKLEGDELEATLLEAADDLADETVARSAQASYLELLALSKLHVDAASSTQRADVCVSKVKSPPRTHPR